MKIKGIKYDDKKLDYTLLPKSALDEVVKVLMYGAKKYPEPDNWLRVPDARNRYNKACLRHMFAEVDKETFDKESKLYHLAHAVASSLFALHFAIQENKCVHLYLLGNPKCVYCKKDGYHDIQCLPDYRLTAEIKD